MEDVKEPTRAELEQLFKELQYQVGSDMYVSEARKAQAMANCQKMYDLELRIMAMPQSDISPVAIVPDAAEGSAV